ncbi:hypothetical protein DQ384_38400 [Sphaerisporangium album]|uniref:DUF4352 domain-containing protein n=1 Tax=Sphaerisporangium album TaxID=509200 RepID=A0A367EM85_9ACTN|nr:hypothetical protein [Sphaerisporangium album]RCG19151.1 hypothetical protein DQ384_38400 [Sphaerisporangium album]
MILPRHAYALAALAALAAACGNSPAPAPVSPTAPTAAGTSRTIAESTPTSPPRLNTTQVHLAEGIESRVTVLRTRQPLRAVIAGLPERKGYQYAGIEVKFCVTKNTTAETVSVSWSPWALQSADGVLTEAMSSWSDEWWAVPLYPQNRQVKEGRCVRGWIPFEVPKGTRANLVSYEPEEGNPLEWAVR